MTTSNPPSGAAPIGLSARLGFQTLDEFCTRYGPSLTRGGIYLRVKEPRPLGTLIRLELRLANGELILQALGTVSFTTGTTGEGLPGMGIRFVELDPQSRTVVERACAGRANADHALPPLPQGVGPALGEYAGQSAVAVSAPAAAE
ncbi:MAG: PilZ domain-containing protein, partial [Myxococcales bacterium]